MCLGCFLIYCCLSPWLMEPYLVSVICGVSEKADLFSRALSAAMELQAVSLDLLITYNENLPWSKRYLLIKC